MKLLLLALDALCVVSVSALGLAHRDIHFGASEVDTAPSPSPSPNEDDGSVAGVDQCFMDGGGCASCCGACTITTDLDNSATTSSCVCYEGSTAPSEWFYGTEGNDCVFIEADDVDGIYVRNQCLEGAE